MLILVGITTKDLSSLNHKQVTLIPSGRFDVYVIPPVEKLSYPTDSSKMMLIQGATQLQVGCSNHTLEVTTSAGKLKQGEALYVRSENHHATIALQGRAARYRGDIFILPHLDRVKVILRLDLDSYLSGVLQSEIPASYHVEAIKAQAVTARTYALHPRIDHQPDNCNVCDSFLCCQCFGGVLAVNEKHRTAIKQTANQILMYDGKALLALFSSCAGGHTESYHNCFSDPKNNAFPPPSLPYLTGVAEGTLPANFSGNDRSLEQLWEQKHPAVADASAPNFRWMLNIPAPSLEAHMHHVVGQLMKNSESAPFIIAPQSGEFGHIDSLQITQRGVAGTAMELMVDTSEGVWKIRKELVIRNVFKNPDLKLTRLKSARILLDLEREHGLLANVNVRGFGWGHGVGLQQTGAQGWALQGKSHQAILEHYFKGSTTKVV